MCECDMTLRVAGEDGQTQEDSIPDLCIVDSASLWRAATPGSWSEGRSGYA